MSNQEALMEKTVAELRQICRDEQIPGMSKKRKDVIVRAILANQAGNSPGPTPSGSHMEKLTKTAGKDPNLVTKADFLMSSVMTHPDKKVGDKCTTAISVSCGASSGKFPVIGKSVAAVGEFLREVLNVDRLAEGLVNGKKVEGNYILQPGDTLEYLKPAGRKG